MQVQKYWLPNGEENQLKAALASLKPKHWVNSDVSIIVAVPCCHRMHDKDCNHINCLLQVVDYFLMMAETWARMNVGSTLTTQALNCYTDTKLRGCYRQTKCIFFHLYCILTLEWTRIKGNILHILVIYGETWQWSRMWMLQAAPEQGIYVHLSVYDSQHS